MGEVRGRIFQISRASPEDGPGLRTVIFLKGCPLNCPWCHNPEGKTFEKLIYFNPELCINCGECEKVCPRKWQPPEKGGWRKGCTACGLCASACPTGARKVTGEDLTPEHLLKIVEKDIPFFNATGGGVTFSGGEPTFQSKFLIATATLFRKKGIHIAIETSGYFPSALAHKIAELFDLIIFDIKHTDPLRFKKYTGGNLELVIGNLRYLAGTDVPVEIRVARIPGFNDSEKDKEEIENFVKSLERPFRVKYLPYNRLREGKLHLWTS